MKLILKIVKLILKIVIVTTLLLGSLLLGSIGFAVHSFAQTGSNIGDTQTVTPAYPGTKNFYYRDLLRPEPYPSGENQSGKVWAWHFSTQQFSLDHPKIFLGVGALSSAVSLIQNTFTYLDTAPAGVYGFRGGMAQYVPQGTYYLHGQVSFFTATTSSAYEIQITQGQTQSNPVTQPHIYVGSPIQIGGGYCSSPGVSNIPFQCSFLTPKFQCVAPYGWACEIRVSVRTSDPAGSAPTAMYQTTNIGSTNVSNLIAVRVGNLDSLQ